MASVKRLAWSKERRALAVAAWTPERRELARKRALGIEEEDKKPNEERELKVVVVCVNPRMVQGVWLEDEEGGTHVLVDVGRNSNFAIGDIVVVRHHAEMGDLSEFVRMKDEGLAVDHVGLPRDKRRVHR